MDLWITLKEIYYRLNGSMSVLNFIRLSRSFQSLAMTKIGKNKLFK